eukprot:1177767-Prorocentrum_minimum.AAC.7
MAGRQSTPGLELQLTTSHMSRRALGLAGRLDITCAPISRARSGPSPGVDCRPANGRGKSVLRPQRVLARELAAQEVLVSACCPGWCATDMSSWSGEEPPSPFDRSEGFPEPSDPPDRPRISPFQAH